MTKHLKRDLEDLNREMLSMSSMVEEMIDKAAKALTDRESDLAVEVASMDRFVDEQEVKIEDSCLKLLALHQPVAVDLRRVATVLKVNNDLERIADLAVNIAERARSVAESPKFPLPEQLNKMVTQATAMVRQSLDCFVNLDSQGALQVLAQDDEIDRMNLQIINELQTVMQQDPELVVPALHCFSASRHIERIADHATNIAEDVIYLVEGEIVRHRHEDEVPTQH